MTCNCITQDWFHGDKSWTYDLECPIHRDKTVKKIGIIPVSITSTSKNEEGENAKT